MVIFYVALSFKNTEYPTLNYNYTYPSANYTFPSICLLPSDFHVGKITLSEFICSVVDIMYVLLVKYNMLYRHKVDLWMCKEQDILFKCVIKS